MARKSKRALEAEAAARAEVAEINRMFQAIGKALDGLEDKTGIDESLLRFDGYDANNEWDHLAAAKAYGLEKAYNSHMRRLPWYRASLAKWKSCRDPDNLTREDLVRLSTIK